MTTFEARHFSIHSGAVKSGAWLLEAVEQTQRQFEAAGRVRFPQIPSKGLDALGITQRKLNGNFNSWADELSDQDKEEGGLWYPTGNDWGYHKADEHDRHPDKVFGAMSKFSPQRKWYDNLEDADNLAANHGHNPGGITKPAGISGGDNQRQAMRVFDAEDHPDAIEAAFLGGKRIQDIPKTYDFKTNLSDPERGGAYNYAAHPGTVDSWMGRSMLWSKKAWDEAQAGGRPLSWHGKGTGEGLDKGSPIKKVNPATGKWEVVGIKPANARDVAARITKMAGGYGRMRQAMQQGAARHDMPFTHGAQAAVWKQISKNKNPNDPEFDHSKVGPAGQQWNGMWNQRASGLIVPQQGTGPGGLHIPAQRLAAHGPGGQDPDGPDEDQYDPTEGWGTAEDIRAIMRHIAMAPPGWDHFEGRPGLISLGPDSPPPPPSTPQEDRSDQRMGPHQAAAGRGPHGQRPVPQSWRPPNKSRNDRGTTTVPDIWQGDTPDEDEQSEFDLTAARYARAYWGAKDGPMPADIAESSGNPHLLDNEGALWHEHPQQGWRYVTTDDGGAPAWGYDTRGRLPTEYEPYTIPNPAVADLARHVRGSRALANANWQDGPYLSQADTGDGQHLMVRHPWGEDDGEYGHTGNPHYEWQHHVDPEERAVTGISDSLDEAKRQAEESHHNLSGGWDPDADQEALDPRMIGAARFARAYFASEDGLDEGLTPDEDKGKQPAVGGSTSTTNPNLNQSGGSAMPLPGPAPSNGGGVSGGGGGGGGMAGGGNMPSPSGGAPAASAGHPDGGPPSQNLTQALQRAGIDPSMYPTISGFSATEGNNPSGAPTLGFTDGQAGSSLDQHALALSKQIKDRASVTGEFPHAGTPEQQASWMATLVGQNGSSSDWQGNAQPARSDYVNRIVKSMPGTAPAPTAGR